MFGAEAKLVVPFMYVGLLINNPEEKILGQQQQSEDKHNDKNNLGLPLKSYVFWITQIANKLANSHAFLFRPLYCRDNVRSLSCQC